MVLFLWGVSAAAAVAGEGPAPQQAGQALPSLVITRAEAPRWAADTWVTLLRFYVRERQLAATDGELDEVAAYDAAFSRTDRARRARKLTELDGRLGEAALPHEEKLQLQRFREVLARLAAHEDAVDRGETESAPLPDRRDIVEFWKANMDLYRRFGGVVTVMPFGHFAHGARLAWLMEAEAAGVIAFSDEATREEFFRFVRIAGPVVPAGSEDFTPYWRRPIPASYFAD